LGAKDSVMPAIGVLDVDGLHLAERPLVPIRGAIRHVGDLYAGARRHGLAQLWVTAAWARAADLPEPATVIKAASGKPTHLRHPFVGDALGALHAFPEGLAPWVSLDKRGEAGAGLAVAFPVYDENATWGEGTDAGTLLAALGAYAAAVGVPYVRSPGKTGTDLLVALGRRGRGAARGGDGLAGAGAGDDDGARHGVDAHAGAGRAGAGLPPLVRQERGVAGGVRQRGGGPGRPGGAHRGRRSGRGGRRAVRPDAAGLLAGARRRRARGVVLHADARASRGAGPVRRDQPRPRLDVPRPRPDRVVRAVAGRAGGALRGRDAGGAAGPRRVQADLRGHDQQPGRPVAPAEESALPAGLAARDPGAGGGQPLAGARALGRMDAAGCTPVAVNIDCVYLVSDEPDAVRACPPTITLGTGLGHFKVHDAGVPLAPLLPAFGLRAEGNEGRMPATLAMGVGMKRLLSLIRETTGADGVDGAEGQEPQESGEEG